MNAHRPNEAEQAAIVEFAATDLETFDVSLCEPIARTMPIDDFAPHWGAGLWL